MRRAMNFALRNITTWLLRH